MSCSRIQHSDSAGDETRTSIPSILSLKLYQLSHCALHWEFLVCLSWFFTSKSQFFSYVWTGLPGWNLSTKLWLMCLAKGQNVVTPVRFEPTALWSRVKQSISTEPLCSPSRAFKIVFQPVRKIMSCPCTCLWNSLELSRKISRIVLEQHYLTSDV